MMIHNEQLRIAKSEIVEAGSLPAAIDKRLNGSALRWYIAQVHEDELLIEATFYAGRSNKYFEPIDNQFYPGKQVVLSIIPTGVGCQVGGYAGDAAPVTSLLASTADYLITNPNAVNGSDFIGLDANVLYTEGSSIDLFCRGLINLYVPYANKVGIIVEKAEDRTLDHIFNIINTVRAVHGVEIVEYLITDQVIGSRSVRNDSGAYVGTIDHPEVILKSCEHLISKGVNAIAITTDIQDLPLADYVKHFAGEDPNPMGGVEAIISHMISSLWRVPAAHAPMLNLKQLDLQSSIVDARGAGEMISISGMACILLGLGRAPQFVARPETRVADVVNINNLFAIVAPASCLGGAPMIYSQKYGIPIIAVQENKTILEVTQEKLDLKNVIEVRNYTEAAGVVMALKRGLSLQSVARPLKTFRHKEDLIEPEFIPAFAGTVIAQ